LQRWLSYYHHIGGHWFCQPGCSNCCDLAVWVTLPEAWHLAWKLPTPLQTICHTQAQQIIELASSCHNEADFLHRYRSTLGPCLFLLANSHCLIHAQRPLSCRGVFSMLPGTFCRHDFPETLHQQESEQLAAQLDRRVTNGTPYLLPPLHLSHNQQKKLKKSMLQHFSFSLAGLLPLLIHLLIAPEQDTGLASPLDQAAWQEWLAHHPLPDYVIAATHTHEHF